MEEDHHQKQATGIYKSRNLIEVFGILHESDKVLEKTGKISPEQIGGQNVLDAITARFSKASSGETENKLWDQMDKQKLEKARVNYEEKKSIMPKHDEIQSLLQKGDEPSAQTILDSMTDEEYKTYKNIRKAEKTKNSQSVKSYLSISSKKAVEFVRSLPEAEQDRIISNMTDEEYAKYEEGK